MMTLPPETPLPFEQEYVVLSDIATILGVGKARVGQLRTRPDFPSPIGRISRSCYWRRSEIEAYAIARIARVAKHDGTPKRRTSA